MTNREFLNAIVANTVTEDAVNFAKAELERMDAANAKRRDANALKAKANDGLVDAIVEMLGATEADAITASDILPAMSGYERPDGKSWNVQFVSSLCRTAVAQGKAVSCDVKVTGKGKAKGYFKA